MYRESQKNATPAFFYISILIQSLEFWKKRKDKDLRMFVKSRKVECEQIFAFKVWNDIFFYN